MKFENIQKKSKSVFLFGIIIFLGSVRLFAQPPETLWTRTYGGSDWDEGYSVQPTSDEGYIIAGWTESHGATYSDVYLIKTDMNGDTIWTRTYGGYLEDRGYSVQLTSDGGYIVTGYIYFMGSHDVYLVKTDSNGDIVWARAYGGLRGDYGHSVQPTSDGGYIVAGWTTSYGAGEGDVYLIKTNANGDTSWTKTYGGVSGEYGYSVRQTADYGYIIVGQTESFGAGDKDVYLVKTDSNGETLWTRTYGGPGFDYGFSVQPTDDGGYIIVGGIETFGVDSSNVYLIKTDAGGDTLWTRTYGGSDDDYGYSVQPTTDSGYIIVGWTESFGAGERDIYLIKTAANGDELWTTTYGGIDMDCGLSVKPTSDEGYIIVGWTRSFGAGNYDVYLIKTRPESGIENKTTFHKLFTQSLIVANPFKERALIKYELLRSCNVKIKIYNLLGEEIKRIVDERQHTGKKTIIWDGRDNNHNRVPNGVYILKYTIGNYNCIKLISKVR